MNDTQKNQNIFGSFRDPSGFIFSRGETILRQINFYYKENYDLLRASGLYKYLTDKQLLIPHEEVKIDSPLPEECYKIIKPDKVPFISYPYEWAFSQFKDAALLTLEIQKKSLDFGMSLKDCSAYNIQFKNGKPIFIDTLSFERYNEGQPWVAYRQFCQHFLAPLAVMAYKDIRLSQLLKIHMDGIPLDLASSLLPFRSRFVIPLLFHIHLHAKAQKHYSSKTNVIKKGGVTRFSFMGLIDSLESGIKKLKWQTQKTEWENYYAETNYSPEGFSHKKQIVSDFLDWIKPRTVWDFGANTGIFSRVAGNKEAQVISFDADPVAVEKNYIQSITEKNKNILPLLVDMVNPSPGTGWNNKERMSLLERGTADTVIALALIHHLAISNNLPFKEIAGFFGKICNSLIIEFIPKEDSQIQRLLSNREDIFTSYTKDFFESEFGKFFTIRNSVNIKGSKRVLYLMERRNTL
jgi:hypothetical protein